MNFLVTYFTPNGKKRVKTFTYNEANAIAKDAISKHYNKVSITPLNDMASTEMIISESIEIITFDEVCTMFKEILLNLLK